MELRELIRAFRPVLPMLHDAMRVERKLNGISVTLREDRIPQAAREAMAAIVSAHLAPAPSLEQQQQPAGADEALQTADAPAFAGRGDNAYLGAGLCAGDLDGDGVDELVMGSYGAGGAGAPQTGRVDIVYSSSGAASSRVGRTLQGPSGTYARFGFSCATLDMNGDGMDDLVVGAPAVGGGQDGEVIGNYTGAVYIYFAPLPACAGCAATPNVTLHGHDNFTSLGFVVQAVPMACGGQPVRGLALGAPFHGAEPDQVHAGAVYLLRARPASQPWPRDIQVQAGTVDHMLTPPAGQDSAFGWFGASVAMTCHKAALQAVVGAPGQHYGRDVQSAVYGYTLASGKGTFELAWTRQGRANLTHFGFALATAPCGAPSGACLVVGAPGYGKRLLPNRTDPVFDMQGYVDVLDFGALLQPAAAAAPPWRRLQGPGLFAHFGWSLAVGPETSGAVALYVGAPLADFETGRVTRVSLARADAPASVMTGDKPLGRYGWQMTVADLGDNRTTLAVGQPTFSAHGGSRQGRVTLVAQV